MKRRHWCGLLLAICINSSAAPSANSLLEACEDALKNGFHGNTGLMCSWYVRPCDCQQGKDNAVPRVCLSGDETERHLGTIVVAGLKSHTALRLETAEMAAAIILSSKYPCTGLF